MAHPQCLAHQSFRLPLCKPAKQRHSCHKCRFRAMAVAAEPKPKTKISRTDLIDYMRSGCRPKEQWRFGTEHEKLGYFVDSHRRIDHEAISKLLHQICTRFSWQPIMEKGNIIGATLENASVTLEPGGQFELSGAPLDSLHKTCSEVNSHLYEVKTIAEELGLAFLTCGFDPKWKYEEVPIMPKYRYKIMREYMPKVGTMGHDMMFRSTTIQVNIDFSSEEDMIEKARVGLALQPVCTALFANSPLKEGKPTGYLSWRSHVWTDVDNARCGTLPFVFDPDFGFERYVDYALQVPMYFVYRSGEYVDVSGEDFRQFMEGNLQQLPGDTPSLADWETHLTCIFPEIRLKRFLEMRGADGGPQSMICALSALWVGLLYDEQSQAAALELISDWTQEDHEQLRRDVPRLALKTPFRGGTVQDLAIRMVQLSREGLQRRRKAEENFLAPLVEIAESGVTQAERLLEEYHQNGDSVDFVFGKEHYF